MGKKRLEEVFAPKRFDGQVGLYSHYADCPVCGTPNVVTFKSWAAGSKALLKDINLWPMNRGGKRIVCIHLKDAYSVAEANANVYFCFDIPPVLDSVPAGPRGKYGLGI